MRLIVKQPNGFFALFSVEDCIFTHFNLSEKEIEIYTREILSISKQQALIDIKNAKLAGAAAFAECLELIERTHSSSALWDVRAYLSQPRAYRIFAWVETSYGAILQCAGMVEQKELDQWVEFQKRRFSCTPSHRVQGAWRIRSGEIVYFYVIVDDAPPYSI